jgi:hypothetical protein
MPCVYVSVFFLRVWENLDFMSPPIWQFEKLGSQVFYFFLPQPTGRPAASRHLVLRMLTCDKVFALT